VRLLAFGSAARLCATVVIAAVSPLAKDVAHSGNTLGYAAPLRVAAAAPVHIERDPRDPALWENAEMVDWVRPTYITRLDIAKTPFSCCLFVSKTAAAACCLSRQARGQNL
jgi:hypothetical protein